MNEPSLPSIELEDDLKEALERLYETGKSVAESVETLSHAAPPVESYMQVTTNTLDFFSKLNWMQVYSQPLDYARMAEPLTSLSEIQSASSKRLTDGQQKLLNTLVGGGQDMVTAVMKADNPQAVLASCINKCLDTYSGVQADLTKQVQTITTLQAAYTAWYQQTLTFLAKSPTAK